MHITIERDGCISCGLCEETCPSVFRIAEEAAVRWLSFMSAENVSVKADRRVCLFTSTARI